MCPMVMGSFFYCAVCSCYLSRFPRTYFLLLLHSGYHVNCLELKGLIESLIKCLLAHHHSEKCRHAIHSSFLTTCFGSLSHYWIFDLFTLTYFLSASIPAFTIVYMLEYWFFSNITIYKKCVFTIKININYKMLVKLLKLKLNIYERFYYLSGYNSCVYPFC
jgi:hypothetical protein